jgi:hypothetical protein
MYILTLSYSIFFSFRIFQVFSTGLVSCPLIDYFLTKRMPNAASKKKNAAVPKTSW